MRNVSLGMDIRRMRMTYTVEYENDYPKVYTVPVEMIEKGLRRCGGRMVLRVGMV
jgi:hypothetical protein